MGIGYQASALHLIAYLVASDDDVSTVPPPGWRLPPIPGVLYHSRPAQFRSPAVATILAWRDRLSAKYRSQLGEPLSWDEAGEFQVSEDAASSGDLMLRYVAALSDEGGPPAVRRLVGNPRPAHGEIGRTLDAAHARGFSGHFPQLLLGASVWLPFGRDLIIEEPSWNGALDRFGSAPRLMDEVGQVRARIRDADPRAVEWTARREAPDQILWAAWQASETIARIGAAAVARHLPLWSSS